MSYIFNRIIETFQNLFTNIYFPNINFYDIIEISIITIVFYFLAKAFKNTRTWVLAKGAMFLGAFYIIAYLMSFNVITKIFESLIVVLVVGIVVIFSPEIKKFLENIGTKKFKTEVMSIIKRNNQGKHKIANETIEEIVAACEQMGKDKTGALIVYEDNIPLNEYIDTGIKMDSIVSRQLLLNIFEHNTPLHDGAIVVKDDIIKAATCYLPLSEDKKISKRHGTRHRAALGISEATDAITIVVSEETGRISVTRNGKIQSVSANGLREVLTNFQNETVVKEEKRKFTDIIKHNLVLKIVSGLFGITLWIIMMSAANPVITTTVSSVPITITNETAITDMDKIYTVKSDMHTTVKITGHRSDVEDIEKEDIKVIADLSLLSEINTIRLTGITTNPDIEVRVVDEIFKIDIEKCIEAEFDVIGTKKGTEDPSTFVYSMTTETEKVKIKGPESIVKSIKDVKYLIDVNKCKRDFVYTATPTLYDKDGKEISSKDVEISAPELAFEVSTVKTKEVPLIVTPSCDAYIKKYINTFSAVPSTIIIAANDRLLENTNVLEVSIPVDLNYEDLFEETYTKEIDISEYVAEGIYIPEANREVDIVIGFASDAMKEISFSFADIELRNFDENKYIIKTSQDNFTTSVFGDKDAILSANIGTLKPYLDLSNIKPGENVLYVEYAGGGSLKISSNNKVVLIVEEIIPETTEPPETTPLSTEPPETTEATTLPSPPIENPTGSA